ncbi:sigma-70 family RNA polymerase sigma factor [Luteolibacter yonseiensis]|uniref:Sigma-70 family RNA polymerase sigma factor n=1 Tax=Luteolibacter yonseiensis TaxID=1144680 RepID=A0A934R4Y9_9BACT|nr:ECF-type sigma factor [Luteolibacter yonseiensis]MBK1817034.1 sigma-70 family RNA polymerase sigma factor [Luteolibacter yonseiensis]
MVAYAESTIDLEEPSCPQGGVAEGMPPLLYRELRNLAASHMSREHAGQTIQATELVHEAWIRLSGNESWKDKDHFIVGMARIMRRILIDRARRKSRVKHGGNLVRLQISDQLDCAGCPEDQLLLVNDALDRLEKIDPVRARVVVLKFFGQMSNQEVAAELGVTERSVERYWAFAKTWLFREIQRQQ